MGDMGEVFNAMREADKERRERNLKRAKGGAFGDHWVRHTNYHWSMTLNGERLDYWPSRNKFRYKGRTMVGDVDGFIRNRLNKE